MASVHIRIDDDLVRRALAGLRAAAGDLYPAMDQIGAALTASTQARFERGRGPDGNPWPQSLRARLQGGQTLVDKAHLVQSITHQATGQGVDVGTNLIYAGIHQFGGTIKAKGGGKLRFKLAGGGFATVASVTMPARPFLGIDDDDERAIGAILADHLRAAAPGSIEGAP